MLKILFRNLLISSFLTSSAWAIVGGVTLRDSLPSYLTAEDRQQLKSHVVALLHTENSSSHSRCTGTLIAVDMVLTAAHCVPANLETLWVVPHQYEFAVTERRRVIGALKPTTSNFKLPTQMAPNNDLAIVRFEGALPVGYKPLKWVNSFRPSKNKFWLYAVGYGDSDFNEGDTGEIRFGRVMVSQGLESIGKSFFLADQSEGEGICKGDSGGPVLMKFNNQFYIVGVVSGITAGTCRRQSYLNQTSYYSSWIANAVGLLR